MSIGKRVTELRLWPRLLNSNAVLPTTFVQQHPEVPDSIVYYKDGSFAEAIQRRGAIEVTSPSPDELILLALQKSAQGSEQGLALLQQLRESIPSEADAVTGLVHWYSDRPQEALTSLVAAFTQARRDPWMTAPVMNAAIMVANDMATQNPEYARSLFAALEPALFGLQPGNDSNQQPRDVVRFSRHRRRNWKRHSPGSRITCGTNRCCDDDSVSTRRHCTRIGFAPSRTWIGSCSTSPPASSICRSLRSGLNRDAIDFHREHFPSATVVRRS